jgi:hypothetical protein
MQSMGMDSSARWACRIRMELRRERASVTVYASAVAAVSCAMSPSAA